MSGYDIYIDRRLNNSLGWCWYIKVADDYDVYDTITTDTDDCVTFLEQYMKDNEMFQPYYDSNFELVEPIVLMIATPEALRGNQNLESYIDKFNRFGQIMKYAVECRSMITALHMIVIYDNEKDAELAYECLSNGELEDMPRPIGQDFVEMTGQRWLKEFENDGDTGYWYLYDSLFDKYYMLYNIGNHVPDVYI